MRYRSRIERPGMTLRNHDRMAPRSKHRSNVRRHRIANHQASLRLTTPTIEESLVGGRVLFGHDRDMVESVGEARRCQLGLLVEQVAFSDHGEPHIDLGEPIEGVSHTGEQLDRVIHELTRPGQNLVDLSSGDSRVRDLYCRLDQRQPKTLDPITKHGEIAPLGLQQLCRQLRAWCVVAEQLFDLAAQLGEETLVVPQGVVGVEGDEVEIGNAKLPIVGNRCHVRP